MDIILREVLEELKCPVCVEYSCVSEWSQHMQHLQTDSESVRKLQKAVLIVHVLASGEYHSENEVSLPVLRGKVIK